MANRVARSFGFPIVDRFGLCWVPGSRIAVSLLSFGELPSKRESRQDMPASYVSPCTLVVPELVLSRSFPKVRLRPKGIAGASPGGVIGAGPWALHRRLSRLAQPLTPSFKFVGFGPLRSCGLLTEDLVLVPWIFVVAFACAWRSKRSGRPYRVAMDLVSDFKSAHIFPLPMLMFQLEGRRV